MESIPNSLEARDIAYHLHGYTNAEKHAELGPMIIERGEGIYVYDNNGNRYMEAMAGLWSTALGFSEPRLVEAAAAQMSKLPFYHTFGHKAHEPAIELADKLVNMAPAPMSKAFFTNSGSEAIDTALKLIWYRSNAMGKPEKKKILARKRAYHGVTAAGSCLTILPANHTTFDLVFDGVVPLTCPHLYKEGEPGESEEAFADRLARELEEKIIEEGPETIAAFFGEPVQGAGGVVVPPAGYWEKVQAILEKYDILLVADEVICGFGRTGNMFGSQTLDIRPDMITLSKQLSSSYLPSSALLINDRVYQPIAEESGRIGTLGHGFTGGGHPVACAVSLETIRIIEEEGLVEHAAQMGKLLQAGLRQLTDHPLVGEARGVGLIGALELVTDKATKAALEKPGQLGALAGAHFQNNGIISRFMTDAMAFCPPLIISESEIEELLAGAKKGLDETLAALPG